MNSTNIRFEAGLDYGVLRSDAPEVVQRVLAQRRIHPGVVIVRHDEENGSILAHIPLQLLAEGFLFPGNKGLRKMADSGGNGSLHISH